MKPEQPAAPVPAAQNFETVADVEAHAKTRMDKVILGLQHEMGAIRTGRASVAIFDNLRVDYYGTPTPLNQVANLHVPEASLITIQPWDVSQIAVIEKAIRAADMGLNPANDGKIIRIPVPPLTEERRKEIVKKLHTVAEDHRVAARNIRRDANEHLKKLFKDKVISEDEERRALEDVQKTTDAHIAKIDLASKTKEKDILDIK
jgi:ribosome recycling factor